MTHETLSCETLSVWVVFKFFFLIVSIYIYFFNKYIALEVRFVFVGHHYCIAIVYTIELSIRLTSFSKILEDIMNMSICTHRVLDCSYILLSYV